MYLKKVDGPRAVTLANGATMTHADGVVYGLISKDDALSRYRLSDDEFIEWVRAVSAHGEVGLKTTMLQKYRQP